MKTLTCKQMGGPCDAVLTADTYDGMMQAGWEHMKVAHPEMVADIEKMGKDDPMMKDWETNFKKTWAETPEN